MKNKINDVSEFIASDMKLITLAVKGECECQNKQEYQEKTDDISEDDLSEITIS